MVAQESPLPLIINLRTNQNISLVFIKVDRGSPWGNPFVKETEAQRNRVCDLFEEYAHWRLTIEPDWLKPIRGKNLACWCAPKRCHAETLLRLANEPEISQPKPVVCLNFSDIAPYCEAGHKRTGLHTDQSCGAFWKYCKDCGWVMGGGMMGHN